MMKDAKKTKVPLPGSKPKSKPQNMPSKAPLSQERIDSDDNSPSESTARPKRVEKPKATIGIHVNGVPKPKSKSSKPSKPDAPSSKSASKSKASPMKPAPKHIATEQDVADLSSSEVSDDDAPARDIQTKFPGSQARQEASSDSDSTSSSSDSSSDESDTDDAPQTPKPIQPQQQPQPQTQSQSHAVDFRPTKAYVPPKGFNPVPLNDKTMSRCIGLFDKLEGKQVWHLTAPANVSLKEVKELAMDKALGGEAVMSYKGTDYGLFQTDKSEDGTWEVLVPNKHGIKTASARITQTLHLQSIVQLPQLSSKQADQNTGSEAAASITRSTIRAPRPQVTGLKMRFLPTGFTGTDGGTLGDSDDEPEPARGNAVLGMPEELSRPSKKQKRKHADVNGADTMEAPTKKSKKHQDSEDAKRKAEKKAKKEKKRAKEAASVGS